MTGPLSYLSRLCRRWGGELVIMPSQVFADIDYSIEGVSMSPDCNHAIDINKRHVFADELAVDAGAVIHEMGHLFLKDGDPRTGYEPDWLGWEIVLARRARCYRIWSRQNEAYQVPFEGGDHEWGVLTSAERGRLAADRIAHAQTLGIVSQDGEPLCTRLP
jgi:hypothetical protein